MYRKRVRYKEEKSNYFKEEAKREVEEVMSKLLSNPHPELMQRLVTAISSQLSGQQPPQMPLVVTLTTTEQALVVPSSIASTRDKVHYPVDEIDSPVPCSLVIRYGFNSNRTRDVAIGLAILGHKFHGSEISEDYHRVEMLTIVQGYGDNMLDISGPEGIEKLGQAINNFILWPQRDVLLSQLPVPLPREVPQTQESSHPTSLPTPPTSLILHPQSPPPPSPIMPQPLSLPPSKPTPPPSPKPHASPPSSTPQSPTPLALKHLLSISGHQRRMITNLSLLNMG